MCEWVRSRDESKSQTRHTISFTITHLKCAYDEMDEESRWEAKSLFLVAFFYVRWKNSFVFFTFSCFLLLKWKVKSAESFPFACFFWAFWCWVKGKSNWIIRGSILHPCGIFHVYVGMKMRWNRHGICNENFWELNMEMKVIHTSEEARDVYRIAGMELLKVAKVIWILYLFLLFLKRRLNFWCWLF